MSEFRTSTSKLGALSPQPFMAFPSSLVIAFFFGAEDSPNPFVEGDFLSTAGW